MQSKTYRASSRGIEAKTLRIDPDNRLLSRFPRRRLQAELIWDHLLAASGELNTEFFGPSVVPPVDKELLATLRNSNWKVTKDSRQWTRRGVYVVVRRSLRFPFFQTFNVNEPTTSCGRRDSTVVAPQALTLLNDRFVQARSQAFASRLIRECEGDIDRIPERAWLYAYARPIEQDERLEAKAFLGRLESRLRKEDPATLVSPSAKDRLSAAQRAAVVEFCRAVFNSNEFLYVD